MGVKVPTRVSTREAGVVIPREQSELRIYCPLLVADHSPRTIDPPSRYRAPEDDYYDYFEYNSTTNCSCAAIGMFGRDGRSSIRPLNVSRSTASHESGAPREA